MEQLVTERLSLREVQPDDADFVQALYNEPAFKRFIGDRGLDSGPSAREFIENTLRESYHQRGFGMYLVCLRTGGEPIGVAGLLKRDELEDVDLGYAISEAHWRHGYAEEAAVGLIEHARRKLGLRRLAAITSPGNSNSIGLLFKLGFDYEGHVDINGEHSNLYLLKLSSRGERR